MSSELVSIFGIATALCLGAISPGPSFVLVARTAASSGRSNGLSAGIGMGFGATLFAIASLLGLNAVLLAIPAFYVALKFIGGLYLAYLGFRIWRGATQPIDMSESISSAVSENRKSYLLLGFATQISNPKTAIVYASVFAAFLPSAPNVSYSLVLVSLVFVIEAGWYAIVATALSSDAPRAAYLRWKKWVDRSAGCIMGALGIRLATSVSQ